MKIVQKDRFFDPHETARAEALTGVSLASFLQRAAALAIDFFVVLLTYGPVDCGEGTTGNQDSKSAISIYG